MSQSDRPSFAIAPQQGADLAAHLPPTSAATTNTQTLNFDGHVTTPQTLPAPVQQALDEAASPARGDEILAEFVVVHTRSARKIDKASHQVMEAVRATSREVVVVTSVRLLAPQADGRLRPTGAWRVHTTDRLASSEPLQRRVGMVTTNPSAQNQPAQVTPKNAFSHLPAEQREAAEFWQVLPAPVRTWAQDHTPDPHRWLSELVQMTRDEVPYRQRLLALRQNEHRAIVIMADRQVPAPDAAALAAADWHVTQLVYNTRQSLER